MTTAVKKGSSRKWMHGLLCGAALAWLPGYSLLAGVLFLPVIAVFFLLETQSMERARMMLPYVFAAAIHPWHVLWDADGSLDVMASLLLDPRTCLLSWGAAAAGWLVLEMTLFMARLYRQYRANRHKTAIEARLKQIEEEWDENPEEPDLSAAARPSIAGG